jgi:hypothetical protein
MLNIFNLDLVAIVLLGRQEEEPMTDWFPDYPGSCLQRAPAEVGASVGRVPLL